MKKITIAFDVYGTLRNNGTNPYGTSEAVVANERIRTLLITLASFKNTRIMVWSGGGELYCHQVVAAMGLQKYVDVYADKRVLGCTQADCPAPDESHWHFGYDGVQPDIAIDDMHDFELGKTNLIVKEK